MDRTSFRFSSAITDNDPESWADLAYIANEIENQSRNAMPAQDDVTFTQREAAFKEIAILADQLILGAHYYSLIDKENKLFKGKDDTHSSVQDAIAVGTPLSAFANYALAMTRLNVPKTATEKLKRFPDLYNWAEEEI